MPKFKKNTSPAMYKPSAFKMNGWSGYQNSPVKKEYPPKITTSTRRDDPQYKLIQALKDDLIAGKITKEEYDKGVKEIKKYKDLD